MLFPSVIANSIYSLSRSLKCTKIKSLQLLAKQELSEPSLTSGRCQPIKNKKTCACFHIRTTCADNHNPAKLRSLYNLLSAHRGRERKGKGGWGAREIRNSVMFCKSKQAFPLKCNSSIDFFCLVRSQGFAVLKNINIKEPRGRLGKRYKIIIIIIINFGKIRIQKNIR